MSHFSVLVIGPDVEKQLAPYHEFECTGEDNEYVQDIDITQDLLAEYEKASAETKTSYPTFTEYVSQYHGKNLVKFGKSPDLSDNHAHKYGYALVDAEGNVTKVVDRTNPNKKWDWYQIGGRWNGYFKLKKPHLGALGRPGIQTMDKGYKPPEKDRADVCPKSAIDIEGMRDEAGEAAAKTYDKVAAIIMGHPKPMSGLTCKPSTWWTARRTGTPPAPNTTNNRWSKHSGRMMTCSGVISKTSSFRVKNISSRPETTPSLPSPWYGKGNGSSAARWDGGVVPTTRRTKING